MLAEEPVAGTGSSGHDAATALGGAAAVMDAGAPIVSRPAQPPASTGMPDAGKVPPSAANGAPDAGNTTPPISQCDALGSYGLRAAIDVAWEATSWSDVGQGTVELFALAVVDAVDPQTGATSGSFRACGLTLPVLNSSALCGSYQLQFPTATWDEAKLAEQKLEGAYGCDAAKCDLRFAPASYSLGIQLTDAHGPWPDFEDTSPSQFSDDDVDGLPGVSVDVVSIASLPSGPNGCAQVNGPTGPGPGNPATAPVMPTVLGRLLVGLRAQLTAAMQLDPDCQLKEVSATDASLDLSAAGCFVMDGSDPASANMGCSEQLRAGFDQTLPDFEALEKGDLFKQSGPGKKQPSNGPILQALRFAPGSQVSCEQVRSSKF
jgi:hypothetical protein